MRLFVVACGDEHFRLYRLQSHISLPGSMLLCVFSHTKTDKAQYDRRGLRFSFVFAKFTFDLNGVAEVYEQAVIDAGGGKVMDKLDFMCWC